MNRDRITPDSFLTLHGALEAQRKFSDRVYDHTEDPGVLTQRMRSMVLGLQSETIELLSAVNFKDHVTSPREVNRDKILYESVDVYRYMLAILNNWGIDSSEFAIACTARDRHLHARKDLDGRSWNGSSPVVVFDLDDVLGAFRKRFFAWIEETYSIALDQNNEQYYCTAELIEAGLNPEAVYERFIQESQVRTLPVIESAAQCIRLANDMGCYIQILTARPGENNRLCYDTYVWLQEQKLLDCIDAVAFSGEKLRWIMKQRWYDTGHLACAFEDSPKHAGEYASHGITTLVPSLPYNTALSGEKNIISYDHNSVDSAVSALSKAMEDYSLASKNENLYIDK